MGLGLPVLSAALVGWHGRVRQSIFFLFLCFLFNEHNLHAQVARRALIEAEGTLVGDDFALTSDQSGDGGDAGAVRAALADLSLAASIQAEAGLRVRLLCLFVFGLVRTLVLVV